MQDMDNNLFFFLKTMICYPYESHLKLYMRNAQIIIFMHINHELQLRAKRSSQSSNEITSKHHHPITKQRQSYQQNIIHVILTKLQWSPLLNSPAGRLQNFTTCATPPSKYEDLQKKTDHSTLVAQVLVYGDSIFPRLLIIWSSTYSLQMNVK